MTGWQEVAVRQLRRATWNYKRGDRGRAAKLRASLERNRQVENLVVRDVLPEGTMEVVNGNHRLAALRALGITRARVFNLGEVSQEEAMRVALETGEIRFDADAAKLAAVVASVREKYSDASMLATLPYTSEQLAALVRVSRAKLGGGAGRATPARVSSAILQRLGRAMEAWGLGGYSETVGELARRELARGTKRAAKRRKD